MKTCNKCQLPKEDSDFHKRANKRSGLQTVCKQCQSEASSVNYLKRKGRIVRPTRSNPVTQFNVPSVPFEHDPDYCAYLELSPDEQYYALPTMIAIVQERYHGDHNRVKIRILLNNLYCAHYWNKYGIAPLSYIPASPNDNYVSED